MDGALLGLVGVLMAVLGVWIGIHIFLFRQLRSIPWFAARLTRGWGRGGATVLTVAFPVGQILQGRGLRLVGIAVELVGTLWMGFVLLALFGLAVAHLGAFVRWLFVRRPLPSRTPPALYGFTLAGLLFCIGAVQGLRPPVLTDYELAMPCLPPERDGLVLVQVSDLHLGGVRGERWLAKRIAQVDALHPELVVITGDTIEGRTTRVEEMVPTLRSLRAPLGVWTIGGNHERFSGADRCAALMEEAGFRPLRNSWVEVVPGLVLAGVEDASHEAPAPSPALESILAGRPPGATILLRHSPVQLERIAGLDVQLMLAGHTHAGQLFPFSLLVHQLYTFIEGYRRIGALDVVISRGTGLWGPPLRLWRPGEIVRVTLRSTAQARPASDRTRMRDRARTLVASVDEDPLRAIPGFSATCPARAGLVRLPAAS
jgi:predicted MPP superfamily phosphohydrolase